MSKPESCTTHEWRDRVAQLYEAHADRCQRNMQRTFEAKDPDAYWHEWTRALERAMAEAKDSVEGTSTPYFGH
eukprot:7180515-Alexandrium_andersonii.AAC.1